MQQNNEKYVKFNNSELSMFNGIKPANLKYGLNKLINKIDGFNKTGDTMIISHDIIRIDFKNGRVDEVSVIRNVCNGQYTFYNPVTHKHFATCNEIPDVIINDTQNDLKESICNIFQIPRHEFNMNILDDLTKYILLYIKESYKHPFLEHKDIIIEKIKEFTSTNQTALLVQDITGTYALKEFQELDEYFYGYLDGLLNNCDDKFLIGMLYSDDQLYKRRYRIYDQCYRLIIEDEL